MPPSYSAALQLLPDSTPAYRITEHENSVPVGTGLVCARLPTAEDQLWVEGNASFWTQHTNSNEWISAFSVE